MKHTKQKRNVKQPRAYHNTYLLAAIILLASLAIYFVWQDEINALTGKVAYGFDFGLSTPSADLAEATGLIAADSIPLAACKTDGWENNRNYHLTQDIIADRAALIGFLSCIKISGGEDITLDCDGHSITRPENTQNLPNLKGILIQNSQRITVKNCVISGFDTGIMANGGQFPSALRIQGNTLQDSTTTGLRLENTGHSPSTITSNTICGNSRDVACITTPQLVGNGNFLDTAQCTQQWPRQNFDYRPCAEAPAPASCTDTDDGRVIGVQGTTNGVDNAGNQFSHTDSCASERVVREYSCDADNHLAIDEMDCIMGDVCTDGACAAPIVQAGEPCDIVPGSTCEAGFICRKTLPDAAHKICAPPATESLYCEADAECAEALRCLQRTCTPLSAPGTFNGPCRARDDANGPCDVGLRCDFNLNLCNTYFSCTDTDFGLSVNEKGITSALDENGELVQLTDSCADETTVTDYECLPDNTARSNNLACPEGELCTDGECVIAPVIVVEGGACITTEECAEGLQCLFEKCQQRTCTDTDNGAVAEPGTITIHHPSTPGRNVVQKDTCRVNTNDINEYVCDLTLDRGYTNRFITCPQDTTCQLNVLGIAVCRGEPLPRSTVTRSFVGAVSPGGELTVRLTVDLAGGADRLTLREGIPAGWQFVRADNDGFALGARQAFFEQVINADITFTYIVRAPADAVVRSEHLFAGTYEFGSAPGAVAIAGETQTVIAPAPPSIGTLGAACRVFNHADGACDAGARCDFGDVGDAGDDVCVAFSCVDNDGGADLNVRSTVVGLDDNGDITQAQDDCLDALVLEYVCDARGRAVLADAHGSACPEGKTCSDGVCALLPPTRGTFGATCRAANDPVGACDQGLTCDARSNRCAGGCVDSDNGNVAGVAGITSGIRDDGTAFSMADSCINERAVTEYSCEGTTLVEDVIACSDGTSCVDGACVASLPQFGQPLISQEIVNYLKGQYPAGSMFADAKKQTCQGAGCGVVSYSCDANGFLVKDVRACSAAGELCAAGACAVPGAGLKQNGVACQRNDECQSGVCRGGLIGTETEHLSVCATPGGINSVCDDAADCDPVADRGCFNGACSVGCRALNDPDGACDAGFRCDVANDVCVAFSCVDNDGGTDLNVRATVVGLDDNEEVVTETDSCLGIKVLENICDPRGRAVLADARGSACPEGQQCADGACAPLSVPGADGQCRTAADADCNQNISPVELIIYINHFLNGDDPSVTPITVINAINEWFNQ